MHVSSCQGWTPYYFSIAFLAPVCVGLPQNGRYGLALKTQIPACAAALNGDTASGIDCTMSGSTAVLAVLESNRMLTVANLGDSRCFVGGVNKEGGCYSIPLSTDHTPALPSEAKRIQSCSVRPESLVRLRRAQLAALLSRPG